MAVVGIDLGTTRSLIAQIDEMGRPAIIKNTEGEALTPSVILFRKEADRIKAIVGKIAKNAMVARAEDVAMLIKRHMCEEDYVFIDGDGKEWYPETLSALILKKLKQDAEKELKKEVTHAVITVPYYFGNLERERTIQAGKIAGLEVLEIIDEPVAALYSYTLDLGLEPMTCCVYDFGGGTFDVCIFEVTPEKEIVVKANNGNRFLGGANLDEEIVRYFEKEFKKKHNIEPLSDPKNSQDFLEKAEKAKEDLSTVEDVYVALTAGGKTIDLSFSRKKLEELISHHVDSTKQSAEIVRYFEEEFKKKHNIEPLSGLRIYQDFLEKAERAKEDLSTVDEVYVALTAGGKTIDLSFSRKKLEELISHHVDSTIQSLEDALIEFRAKNEIKSQTFSNEEEEKQAIIRIKESLQKIREKAGEEKASSEDKEKWEKIKREEWEKIDKILLVGGSTRIPLVKKMIKTETGKEPEEKGFSPDDVVALGASIQAAWKTKNVKGQQIPPAPEVRDSKGRLVLPGKTTLTVSHSLGVKAKNSLTDEFINSKIIFKGAEMTENGVEKKELYYTDVDNQTAVEIIVLQGEDDNPQYCRIVGSKEGYILDGIPPRQAGKVKIVAKMRYDRENIVHIDARAIETDKDNLDDITEDELEKAPKLEIKAELKWLDGEELKEEQQKVGSIMVS